MEAAPPFPDRVVIRTDENTAEKEQKSKMASEVPTTDISAFLDSSSPPTAKVKVVQDVKEACSQFGFLQIIGHGVPVES